MEDNKIRTCPFCGQIPILKVIKNPSSAGFRKGAIMQCSNLECAARPIIKIFDSQKHLIPKIVLLWNGRK